MRPPKLSPEEIQTALEPLSGWSHSEAGISKTFTFSSYGAGVAFAVQVALLAEKTDHHPDALTIAYKKVTVTYITHSAGGVTALDLEAAKTLSSL
jgi:4a-hydroxytetrahydrobiopterin dehydratase